MLLLTLRSSKEKTKLQIVHSLRKCYDRVLRNTILKAFYFAGQCFLIAGRESEARRANRSQSWLSFPSAKMSPEASCTEILTTLLLPFCLDSYDLFFLLAGQ